MQASVPRRSSDKSSFATLLRQFCVSAEGDKQTAVINRNHIGTYVARILADPRTVNQWVFVHEDQLSLREIFELAGNAAGERFYENAEVVSLLSPHAP